MTIEPFRPEHLKALVLQPAQEYVRPQFERAEYGKSLVHEHAYSAFIDGRVVACTGVLPIWEGRGEAWAMIAGDIGARGMDALHYRARKLLAGVALRRIEASCDAAFEPAHRWLRLLGFTYEGPLRSYTPDGRDSLRFARIR